MSNGEGEATGLEQMLERLGDEQQQPAMTQLITRTRREWFTYSFDWGRRKIPAGPPNEQGQVPLIETHALTIVNPQDGSEEIFYFSDDGKKHLLSQMTGGVVLPG